MTTIKMTYAGFEFDANPATLTAVFSKKLVKKHLPFGFAKVKEMCFEPTRITGEGYFAGTDAPEKAHTLMHLFQKEGSSYLLAPDFSPMKMFFSELNVRYDAGSHRVYYRFAFEEDPAGKRYAYPFGYTFARAGETLFDIANRTDTAVEELFQRNQYLDMFSVSEGDKVWLN